MGNYRPRYFEHIHHRAKQRAGGTGRKQPDRQRQPTDWKHTGRQAEHLHKTEARQPVQQTVCPHRRELSTDTGRRDNRSSQRRFRTVLSHPLQKAFTPGQTARRGIFQSKIQSPKSVQCNARHAERTSHRNDL